MEETERICCKRCGYFDPPIAIINGDGEPIGCNKCPDTHIFFETKCMTCEHDYFDLKLPPFCKMRQH